MLNLSSNFSLTDGIERRYLKRNIFADMRNFPKILRESFEVWKEK